MTIFALRRLQSMLNALAPLLGPEKGRDVLRRLNGPKQVDKALLAEMALALLSAIQVPADLSSTRAASTHDHLFGALFTTPADLADRIANAHGLTKITTRLIVGDVFDVIAGSATKWRSRGSASSKRRTDQSVPAAIRKLVRRSS